MSLTYWKGSASPAKRGEGKGRNIGPRYEGEKMSLFGSVPWKAFTQFIPVLVDIIFKVRGDDGTEKEQKEINELKAKMKTLDAEINSIFKGLRVIIVGILVIFLVSVSALVVGIIAMSK